MNILVVTPNYPIEGQPVYTFVKSICDEFAKNHNSITVLAPQSITSAIIHRTKLRPKKRTEIIDETTITILQPYTVTPPHRLLRLYNYMIKVAALFFLKRNKLKPDVCYCHFWCSAYFVMPYIKSHNIPLIVATGESEIKTLLATNYKYPDFNNYVKGVVCVSSKNRDESISLGYTRFEKCAVFPNAVDASLFHQQDKLECRRLLGLPLNDFIVAFVGLFDERKGPLRLAEALNRIKGVKSIFIGEGLQDPQCEGILFKGPLAHNQIPKWLSASDCFVLPTLREGCCNAVIEAMAVGLPVISSNMPFNRDVLDDTNSILINPNSIDEIANSIVELRDNPEKCKRLSENALKRVEKLTIDRRARDILDFIKTKL